MLGVIYPLFCYYLNVFISDLERYLPLIDRKIGYGVIGYLICHVSRTFSPGSLVIRHDSQILFDMIKVHLKLFIDFLSVNSPLINLL